MKELRFYCPGWVETLEDDHWLKQEMIEALKKLMSQTDRLEDVESALSGLSEAEHLKMPTRNICCREKVRQILG